MTQDIFQAPLPPTPSHQHQHDEKCNHCHWNKRWMVYSKENVMEKLMENLDTLLKYFNACEDAKHDIIYNAKMNDYIKSRLQNIHNLVASLALHDEIPNDQFSHFDYNQGEIEKDFAKSREQIDIEKRTEVLRNYLDAIFDMSIFDEESEEDEEEDDGEEEEDFIDNEVIVVPDNASIIDVNNECKKRKQF